MDIIERLEDLHHQATVERSHYYTGNAVNAAIEEIKNLRAQLRVERALNERLLGRGHGAEQAGSK